MIDVLGLASNLHRSSPHSVHEQHNQHRSNQAWPHSVTTLYGSTYRSGSAVVVTAGTSLKAGPGPLVITGSGSSWSKWVG